MRGKIDEVIFKKVPGGFTIQPIVNCFKEGQSYIFIGVYWLVMKQCTTHDDCILDVFWNFLDPPADCVDVLVWVSYINGHAEDQYNRVICKGSL